jgi:hypothetical protein
MIQTHKLVQILMQRGSLSKRKLSNLIKNREVDPQLAFRVVISIISIRFHLLVIKIIMFMQKEEIIMIDMWVMDMTDTPYTSITDSTYNHTCSQEENEHQ